MMSICGRGQVAASKKRRDFNLELAHISSEIDEGSLVFPLGRPRVKSLTPNLADAEYIFPNHFSFIILNIGGCVGNRGMQNHSRMEWNAIKLIK